MYWVIGCIANGVVAVAYLLIVAAIVVPLIRSQQVRSNRLGMATAAIFFTCAVHHGGHVVHMLLPYADLADRPGLAMRAAYDWEMAFWDIITALVGVYYWTLRRNLAADVRGAKLFEDLRQREQEALALNDDVLQGLVVAKLAIELGQTERAMSALDATIAAASGMVSSLLGSHPSGTTHGLRRPAAASLRDES
jgi:hypothetical protein